MKLSVSLPDEDVEFLDTYASESGVSSRSAALHRAVRLLKASRLGAAYEAAWGEWGEGGDADVWESAVSDGLSE
jgi:Arc/MetJ-type ribon-helix-helix transcriptional regulator